MNIISEITAALSPLGMEPAVGMYDTDGKPYPDQYIVIIPLGERNDDEADNEPLTETTGAYVNLYKRGDYQSTKDSMKSLLKTAGFFIADSHWVTFEKETKHHQYVFEVEKTEVL